MSQIVLTFLGPIFSAGLFDALQRLYFEWPESRRKNYMGSLWLISLGISLVLCLVLQTTGQWFASKMFVSVQFKPYLELTLWTAFFSNFSLLPAAVMRVTEELRKYAYLSVASFLIQSGLIIWLVVFQKSGAVGFLQGQLWASAIMAFVYAFWTLQRIGRPVSFREIRPSIKYALPVVPSAVLEGMGSVLDRFLLDKLVSLHQIGLYTQAQQLGTGFNVFNQVMKSAWFPFVFRIESERTDAPALLARYSGYYVALLTVPGLAVALLADDVIRLFGATKYLEAAPLVPLFVSGYFIQGLATAIGRGIDLSKKMAYAPLVTLGGTAASLAAMIFLIPGFGIMGALYGFLIGMSVKTALQIGLSLWLYPRPVEVGRLLTIIAFPILIYLGRQMVDIEDAVMSISLEAMLVALCVVLQMAKIGAGRTVLLIAFRWIGWR